MTSSSRVEVFVNLGDFADAPQALLESAVRHTLAEQEVEAAEFSVTLLGDEAITELNRRYLAKDGATDVIAFSLGEESGPLGDIYIGGDQARRQAEELGVDLDEELVRLVVHGTLHVLGHDHPEGADRGGSAMFVLQERLVPLIMSRAHQG